MVRVKGLEPPRLAAPEPKSGASANFATPAQSLRIYIYIHFALFRAKSVLAQFRPQAKYTFMIFTDCIFWLAIRIINLVILIPYIYKERPACLCAAS